MGAFTPLGQVWYPDTSDTAELNVLLSTVASSIEDGLQPRLAHQELAVGLKASLDGWTIPPTNIATNIPVTVTAGLSDFNQGFSFSAGVATVVTAGMYLVTASLAPRNPDNAGGCKVFIVKNSTIFAGSEVAFNNTVWINAQATSVINCVAGDTIRAQGTLSGTPGSAHTSYGQNTYLSIAMVQALPL